MDHIFIRDFRLQTLIGFHRRERVVPQTIRLDLEIGIANAAVFSSDYLSSHEASGWSGSTIYTSTDVDQGIPKPDLYA